LSIIIAHSVNIVVIGTAFVGKKKIESKKTEKLNKRKLITKYKKFLLYDVWSALVNNLSWMIVPILMNVYYGNEVAGQYSIGLKVIQVPASIIGAAIGQVFLKNASEKLNDNTLYEYTVGMVKKLVVYTIPFAIILFLFGPKLFSFVFGQQWQIAGYYSQILAPWAVVWFVSSPISGLYTVLQKQEVSFMTSGLNLITRIASLYIGGKLNSDVLGLVLFSVSGVLANGLSIYLCIRMTKNLCKKIHPKNITN